MQHSFATLQATFSAYWRGAAVLVTILLWGSFAQAQYGTINPAAQNLCSPANGAPQGFSVAPELFNFPSYRWYSKVGVATSPASTDPITGWTLETDASATSRTFDPPAGRTSTRTYACRVTIGLFPTTTRWASGSFQVTALPALSRGFIANANQSLPAPADPANISFSILPSGATAFTYEWRYKDGINASPSGNNTTGWIFISGASSSSYNPPAGLTNSRTYACLVRPAGVVCGTGGFEWASGSRQITVGPTFGRLATSNQTGCAIDLPNITFSVAPAGALAFAYQWYETNDPDFLEPTGSTVPAGWSRVGSPTNSYDPFVLENNSTTDDRLAAYACFVTANGVTSGWASGVSIARVYRQGSLGSLAIANQTLTAPADPAIITLDLPPDDQITASYQWYYKDGIAPAPTLGSTLGWTLISGANLISYNPPAGLLNTRTYACFVGVFAGADPFSGSLFCDNGGWASGTRQITIPGSLVYGNIAAIEQFGCAPIDGLPIGFVIPASGAASFSYQWYNRSGEVPAPTGSSTTGWTLETSASATTATFDPPAGRTSTRTYACLVTPASATPNWAAGTKVVLVIAPISNIGTIAVGNQALAAPAAPATIVCSPMVGGAGVSFRQWYYQDGIIAAPTGNSTLGWTLIPAATNSTYTPPGGLTVSRTYACFIYPELPICGSIIQGWANGVRQITIVSGVLNLGTIINFNELGRTEVICNTGSGSPIAFETPPSGAASFAYQWYFQPGSVLPPSGTSSTGWTLETAAGNTSQSFDPPAGRPSTITYACFVTPSAGAAGWAANARVVQPLVPFALGTLAAGNQTLTAPADPANITFSTTAVGSSFFFYNWYYQDGIVAAPVGTSTTGWTFITSSTGSPYDPPAGLAASRTYACFISPSGTPLCGTSGWASGVRQVTIPVAGINFGTLTPLIENLCSPANGAASGFSTAPSGAPSFAYQWFVRTGDFPAPTGTSTTGWNLETAAGNTNPTFDPPAGRTSSRTYACFVTPSSAPGAWASGRKQVLITGACRNGFDNQTQQPASLAQNAPNPASGETTISLYIPEGSKAVRLSITRLDGRIVESIAIHTTGAYTHTVLASSLAAGIYQYSLVVDGQPIATKRMVVLK